MNLNHIVYISRAVRPLSDQDLQELLEQCRRDNATSHITGILFYSHSNIAQLFEGEPDVTENLFNRIKCDGRHSHVQKLIEKPISVRSFPEWHMAFHPLEGAAFSQLQGFLMPDRVPAPPDTLTIADAMLIELVRLAVFGPSSVPAFPTLPGPSPV